MANGTDQEIQGWRLIVKYVGDINEVIKAMPDVTAISLFGNFAILRVPESQIDQLLELPVIIYGERPKEIYYSLDVTRSVSCINTVQTVGFLSLGGTELSKGLSGKGVLVGIADSGIDLTHPAFRDEEGGTRVAWLWDQTGNAQPQQGLVSPAQYPIGVEWSGEKIDQYLQGEPQKRKELPTDRTRGHGTAVAGVAAGNGRGSAAGRYRGVAVESPLIVVKLAEGREGFSRTTEVMMALDYMVRKAMEMSMPIAVNLSYGNNDGAHDGNSLFEEYITSLAGVWKNMIVIAAGNEGDARHHASLQLQNQPESLSFALGGDERSVTMQIWKNYVDDFAVFLVAPDGKRVELRRDTREPQNYVLGNNRLVVLYGEPTPYSIHQEISLGWLPLNGDKLSSGIWQFLFVPEQIKAGLVELWLPTTEAVGLSTGFLTPSAEVTLTIPSTARKVVTVGAYDGVNLSPAPFSGRGDTADGRQKPDLVAPGVAVVTATPGGGYGAQTGTSIAAPLVTGSCALLMEWGIVQGHDPYLYGEKGKAYLLKGARQLPGFERYPNNLLGWGALCLRDSLPE